MADRRELTVGGKPISSLRVVDLKVELEKRSLPKSGSKKDLVERLRLHLQLEEDREAALRDEEHVPNLSLCNETENDFIREYLAAQQARFQVQREAKKQFEEKKRESEASAEEAETTQDEDEPSVHSTPSAISKSPRKAVRPRKKDEGNKSLADVSPLPPPPPPQVDSDSDESEDEDDSKSASASSSSTPVARKHKLLKYVEKKPSPKKPAGKSVDLAEDAEETFSMQKHMDEFQKDKSRTTRGQKVRQQSLSSSQEEQNMTDEPEATTQNEPVAEEVDTVKVTAVSETVRIEAKTVTDESNKIIIEEETVVKVVEKSKMGEVETVNTEKVTSVAVEKETIAENVVEELTIDKDTESVTVVEKETIKEPEQAEIVEDEPKIQVVTEVEETVKEPEQCEILEDQPKVLVAEGKSLKDEVDAGNSKKEENDKDPHSAVLPSVHVEESSQTKDSEEDQDPLKVTVEENSESSAKLTGELDSDLSLICEAEKEEQVVVPAVVVPDELPAENEEEQEEESTSFFTEVVMHEDTDESQSSSVADHQEMKADPLDLTPHKEVSVMAVDTQRSPVTKAILPESPVRKSSPLNPPQQSDDLDEDELQMTEPGEILDDSLKPTCPEEGKRTDRSRSSSGEGAQNVTVKVEVVEAKAQVNVIEVAKVGPTRKLKLRTKVGGLMPESDNNKVQTDVGEGNGETVRKRRWGTSQLLPSKKPAFVISTDSLKSIVPDARPLTIDQVRLGSPSSILPKEQAKPAVVPVTKVEEGDEALNTVSVARIVTIEKAEIKAAPLSTSTVGPSSSKPEAVMASAGPLLEATSPARNPRSCVLQVSNLVRPFTVNQLKELLARTGQLIDGQFWIDRVKSSCLVQYETEEEAEETRSALHGIRWPTSNPKSLFVDYSTEEELANRMAGKEPTNHVRNHQETAPNQQQQQRPLAAAATGDKTLERGVREWDLGKTEGPAPHEAGEPVNHHKTEEVNPSAAAVAKEETPAKLLDDLFRKTKTTPCVYWLPLTAQQIAEKVLLRNQRLKEREQRQRDQHKQRQDELDRRQRQREQQRERERGRNQRRDSRKRSRSSSTSSSSSNKSSSRSRSRNNNNKRWTSKTATPPRKR